MISMLWLHNLGKVIDMASKSVFLVRKDCQDRKVGCHGSCEKYLAVKKDHDEKRIKAYELKQQDREIDNMRCETHIKIQKRQRR